MKRCCFFLLFLVVSFRISAQVWVVPAENEAKLSPAAFTDADRKSGGDLFNTNCKSCHGDPGKGNAVKLTPPPPDPAAAQMQNNKDGALFFKVAEGRGPMPSFKNTLSAADIWKIISFIRSFNDKYTQEVAKKTGLGTAFEQVKILMSWNKEKNLVEVTPTYVKENKLQHVVGAEIKLYAKMYFGNLMIDETRTTDNQGIASFKFPKDLPGDAKGVIRLMAKPVDDAAFGEAKADTSLAIAVPTIRPPLNEPRAMWNVVQKTPVWLLLTYSFTVLAVWGFIIYILLQIRTIFKLGK